MPGFLGVEVWERARQKGSSILEPMFCAGDTNNQGERIPDGNKCCKDDKTDEKNTNGKLWLLTELNVSRPLSTLKRCSGVISLKNNKKKKKQIQKISHDPSLNICSQSLLKTSSHPFNNEVETGEGRHSLFTCSLLLRQKCLCQANISDPTPQPRLLLSVVCIPVSGAGYWGQVSLQGGERSPLRWGNIWGSGSVGTSLVAEAMHIIFPCPDLFSQLQPASCVMTLFCVGKRFMALDFCLFSWLSTLPLSWLIFYLQSDFWVQLFSLSPCPLDIHVLAKTLAPNHCDRIAVCYLWWHY